MNRYHKKRDGILLVLPSGDCRYLTFWERVLLFFSKETTR